MKSLLRVFITFEILLFIIIVIVSLTLAYYLKTNQNQNQNQNQNKLMKAPDDLEQRNYPETTIAEISSGKWNRPRATVIGKITFKNKEADGDDHIRIEDNEGNFIVCESVPECPAPNIKEFKIGDTVKISGIVRFDSHAAHNWYELHPFFTIKKVKE